MTLLRNPSTASRLVAGPSRLLSTSAARAQAPIPLPTKPASQKGTAAPTDQLSQLQRYPAHPLLQFFHQYPTTFPSSLPNPPTTAETRTEPNPQSGEDKVSLVVNFPHAVHARDLGKDGNGRSWRAAELRLKSSKDLHTLWYVLLMERNKLATSWEELGRIGGRQAARIWNESLSVRNHRVRKSMARIKLVLNERRLALIDAQQQVRDGVDATASAEEGAEEDASLFEDDGALPPLPAEEAASEPAEAQSMAGSAARSTAA